MSDAGRILRVAMAVALFAATLSLPAAAHADTDGYLHHWQAETIFAGETGATATDVLDSSIRIDRDGDRYAGAIVYADLLGIADPGGRIVSQATRIELDLTGRLLEGGSAAGGTFSGRATVTERQVGSLDAAVSPDVLSAAGVETVFEVRGQWGALVEDDVLAGEVLFQRVRHLSGDGFVPEPAWFNRASLANPDGLGDPQEFRVMVTGDDPDTGGGNDTGGENDTGAPGSSGSGFNGVSAGGSAGDVAGEGGSVLAYIRRGIRGVAPAGPVPVTPAEEQAASRLFESRPAGARSLPANAVTIDVDLGGAYLDAKNRAAGLLGLESGPVGAEAESLGERAAEIRAAAALAVTGDDLTPGELHTDRIKGALVGAQDIVNAEGLLETLELLGPQPDRDQIALLRTWAAVAEAVASPGTGPSVLAGVDGLTVAVAEAPVPGEGPLAEAVLAAADSPLAPSGALLVSGFERESEHDVRPERGAVDPSLPGRVLALHGSGSNPPPLVWDLAGVRASVAPEVWSAHRRADGSLFWLAGESSDTGDGDTGDDAGGEGAEEADVALTDSSVRGWAFTRSRAALVDAARCGRVLAHFRME